MSRLAAVVLASVVVSGLTACSPGYVLQAAVEEAKILWRRKPIGTVLEDPDLDPSRREKLELVLDVRRFATEEVGLEVDGSYGSVSETTGDALVHVLTASRRDRLEPYTWWFPVVGNVPYKGFFDESDARARAAALEDQEYDTYVRSATAFSTLGWFDDPLPSHLLDEERRVLVDVIFHELFHNTLFLPGEIVFNESAATFVGRVGAIEYFCRSGEAGECDAVRAAWADTLVLSKFMDDFVERLRAFYAAEPPEPMMEEGRRRIFREVRRELRELPFESDRYDGFLPETLNNAVVLHRRTYYHRLRLFDRLYRREGSLAGSIRSLRQIVGKDGDPFEALAAFLADPAVSQAREPLR